MQHTPRQSLIALWWGALCSQLNCLGCLLSLKGLKVCKAMAHFHAISRRWNILCVFRSTGEWMDTSEPPSAWTVWCVHLLRVKTGTHCVVICPLGLPYRKNLFWLWGNVTKWTCKPITSCDCSYQLKRFKVFVICAVGVGYLRWKEHAQAHRCFVDFTRHSVQGWMLPPTRWYPA